MTRHTLVLPHAGLGATAFAVALTAGHSAAPQPPLAARIVPTDPSAYRQLEAVHAGATPPAVDRVAGTPASLAANQGFIRTTGSYPVVLYDEM